MSRLNGREIDFYYPRLVKRDGEYCQLCNKTVLDLSVEKLEIHEIKYERPLKMENMKLLCHGCNHKEYLNRENIDSLTGRDAPVEYKMSRKIKPFFLEWLTGKMQTNNYHMPYKQIVKGGSYYTGMHVQTIKNWLDPLLDHPESPYITWGDEVYLKGKEPHYIEPHKYEFDEKVATNDK